IDPHPPTASPRAQPLSRNAGEGLISSPMLPQSEALNRPISQHRDPVARASVGPVVPHRVVLDAAIVPERDRVLLPAETALKEGARHVLVEIAQDAVAFVARDAVDVAGEALVDVERLAAGHRVGAHDRVVGARVGLLVLDPIIGVLAAVMLAIVPGGETV